ncbi:ribbon-helix-helix domain-containing protein [Neosynechococcus sphagnicola]|nr:ribbon-helix-helix domain-containing protein [Neosynechococcus sphagnicola]
MTHDAPPVCVKLPPALDVIVRALPNRSEWLRQAIQEKAQREGLL